MVDVIRKNEETDILFVMIGNVVFSNEQIIWKTNLREI